MDLAKYSISELNDLQERIKLELEKRKVTEKQLILKEIKTLVETRGFSLEELMGGAEPKQAKGAKRRTVAIKYRHPENPALTWTGRGRSPVWVSEWTKAGKTLESLLVK